MSVRGIYPSDTEYHLSASKFDSDAFDEYVLAVAIFSTPISVSVLPKCLLNTLFIVIFLSVGIFSSHTFLYNTYVCVCLKKNSVLVICFNGFRLLFLMCIVEAAAAAATLLQHLCFAIAAGIIVIFLLLLLFLYIFFVSVFFFGSFLIRCCTCFAGGAFFALGFMFCMIQKRAFWKRGWKAHGSSKCWA